ncbi:uncharacterized protein [Haliotis cracherodii]|uniref:uncharacterized protein n=1 Tax=Haliotis cracherodii TaxID=6455 RepID=UPI0039E7D06D
MLRHLTFHVMVEHTRIIRHQNNVYKIRVNIEESSLKSRSNEVISFETMEPVIRAVLYAEERGRLLGFVDTKEYTVSCAKKYWKASEKLGFKQNGKTLVAYPYMLLFNVRLKPKCNEATRKRAVNLENSRAGGTKGQRGYMSDKSNRPISIADINQNYSQPVVVLSRVSVPSCNQQKKNPANTPVRRSARKIGTQCLRSERFPEKRKLSSFVSEPEIMNSSTKRLRFNHEDGHNNCSGKKRHTFSGVDDFGELSQSEPRDSRLHRSTMKNSVGEEMVMPPTVPKLTEKLDSSSSQRITSGSHRQAGNRTESQFHNSTGLSRAAIKNTRKSPRILHREKTEKAKCSPGPSSPPRETHRRASSGFWRLMETLLTPVKLLTGRRSK